MKLFDFLNQEQAKADELSKKATAFGEKAKADPAGAFTALLSKPKKGNEQTAEGQILKQRDMFKKNGFKEYTFHANHDCCDICAKLNGKHFPISRLKIGTNAPPMHDGCKCSISAYEDDEEYKKWLNSL